MVNLSLSRRKIINFSSIYILFSIESLYRPRHLIERSEMNRWVTRSRWCNNSRFEIRYRFISPLICKSWKSLLRINYFPKLISDLERCHWNCISPICFALIEKNEYIEYLSNNRWNRNEWKGKRIWRLKRYLIPLFSLRDIFFTY